MASDTITILTDTNGRFATKQFQRLANGEWHVTGYSNMSRFRWREETIDGIHSLAEVLKAVSTEASSFPIRGRIHDDQRDNEIVRRRLDTFGGRRGDGPGLASFHKPIRDAIFDHLYGCLVLPRDFEPIKGKIRAAVIAAPKRSDRQKDVARYCSDAYLDETIAGAIRRTRGRTIAIRTAGDGQGLANDASAETDAVDLEEAGRRLEAEVDAFFEAAP